MGINVNQIFSTVFGNSSCIPSWCVSTANIARQTQLYNTSKFIRLLLAIACVQCICIISSGTRLIKFSEKYEFHQDCQLDRWHKRLFTFFSRSSFNCCGVTCLPTNIILFSQNPLHIYIPCSILTPVTFAEVANIQDVTSVFFSKIARTIFC